MKKGILLVFSLMFGFQLHAQKTDNYNLIFKMHEIGNNVIDVKCSFDIDFQGQDSIILSFGGNLKEISVLNLKIRPSYLKYNIDTDEKQLVIHRRDKDNVSINMNYTYVNVMSVFASECNPYSEIWELTATCSEFFYPLILCEPISYSVSFNVRKGIGHLLSCPTTGRIRTPIEFIFYDEEAYTIIEKDNCRIFQISSEKASIERENELDKQTKDCISYFENFFKESYCSPELGTTIKPIFFFYRGNDTWNRYDNGFIVASQVKFSTADDILPLAHEICHRWLGEYTLPMKEGEGQAFLMESINEFMTWQFVREVYGDSAYSEIVAKSKEKVASYAVQHQLVSQISITKNTNWVQTYEQGPLLLDDFSSIYGYEAVKNVIVDFYKNNKFNRDVCLADFMRSVSNIMGKEAADYLMRVLSNDVY